ncbi:MAG: HEAT repeat domain-containing protein [Planctomycetes bacterium]|nr:HEAT repeat domain-containing protein [Planctomycetota bacterium]
MVRFFCPNCWGEVDEGARSCPHCGVDIEAFWGERDYVEHLILSLRHPEPHTPIRAAWILGHLRDERAVAPLARLLQEAPDVYIARAAAEALGGIGTPAALAFLRTMRDNPATIVREAVEKALSQHNSMFAAGAGAARKADVS